MKYFRLYDVLAPANGDLYRVDPVSGKAWMVTDTDEKPIPAFAMVAEVTGTTQFFQLQDYASKYGRLEETAAP